MRGQTPLHIVEEPHIQREGRYPYEGEEAKLFLLFSLKNNNLQGKSIFKNPPQVTVVGSGLRAVTKEHGLTEYWANRYFN